MDGYNVAVFNHKTEEDVTREVLISLILDQTTAGNKLFSEDLMREIIKFYGHPMRDLFKATLDQSHNMFASLWGTPASFEDKES
jgi:polyhydroxyalkanoate synthesis repressor PhaR